LDFVLTSFSIYYYAIFKSFLHRFGVVHTSFWAAHYDVRSCSLWCKKLLIMM